MTNAPPTNQVIEKLLTVLDVVREHAPPGAAEWFVDGVHDCMNDKGSLDACLGIAAWKQGGADAMHRYNAYQRNCYLMEAHKLCFDDRPWFRSRELSGHVTEFYELWPAIQHIEAPDESWSQLRVSLFLAFKWGNKYKRLPPRDINTIHEIWDNTDKNKSFRVDDFSV